MFVGGICLVQAVGDGIFKIHKLGIIFRIEALFLNKFPENAKAPESLNNDWNRLKTLRTLRSPRWINHLIFR
jgi:hypothetical protein